MKSRKSSGSESGEATRKPAALRRRAALDIRNILVYLDSERPSAADHLAERIRDARRLLAEMPLLGRMARSTRMLRKGYRCFVLDDYNLYYKIEGDEVTIWRVMHGNQRPPDTG